jgi:hypothetical protein
VVIEQHITAFYIGSFKAKVNVAPDSGQKAKPILLDEVSDILLLLPSPFLDSTAIATFVSIYLFYVFV